MINKRLRYLRPLKWGLNLPRHKALQSSHKSNSSININHAKEHNMTNYTGLYIGTSFSWCVKSITDGDIRLEQVVGIESSTCIENEQQ